MLGRALTFWLAGVDARLIEVEAAAAQGTPAIAIVGLPDRAVQEARQRVRQGIVSSGFDLSKTKLTVNLAPARERKEGTGFDLAIAFASLVACGQMPGSAAARVAAIAEIGLDGRLKPVPGVLAMAEAAGRLGLDGIVVAPENAGEALLADAVQVLAPVTLEQAVAVADGRRPPPPLPEAARPQVDRHPDLADVCGQARARRAVEIAAAGSHNILMCGPPGSGKSMLARRLPGLLPPPDAGEVLEIARVRSAAGLIDEGVLPGRPFRSPHHSASTAALVGSARLRPGEVSLAHRGVLFLDELAEFQRPVLEALRLPLEDGEVVISRAAGSARMPARALVVAAMNPCPCGYHGDPGRACRCEPRRREAYRTRISGPLLDRFDLLVEVPRADAHGAPGEGTSTVAARVAAARSMLARRPPATSAEAEALLGQAVERSLLSARGRARALRVARSIAALAGEAELTATHIAEALSYRTELLR